MENSAIEWCHHTFNPWRGCSKVSPGCANCYASVLSKRNPKTLGVWGPEGNRVVAAESYWREPIKWNAHAQKAGERRRVFCASLADVFEDWTGPMLATNENPMWWCHGSLSNSPIPASGLPEGCRMAEMGDIRERLFETILLTPWLDWLLLTKRPENVAKLSCWSDGRNGMDWPDNVWLGTSVENQEQADLRIPHLLKTPAKVRFLSCEPLLGELDLTAITTANDIQANVLGGVYTQRCDEGIDHPAMEQKFDGGPKINWVIVGGESGHGARPMHPDWALSLRGQCQAAGVPFFFKQWGEFVPSDGEEITFGQAATEVLPWAPGDLQGMCRVGKHVAGNLLDGVEWQQFPEAHA